MKLSTVALAAFAVCGGLFSLRAVTPAELYMTLSIEQVFDGDEPVLYLAFPSLHVPDDGYTHEIVVSSPTQAFLGYVNHPEWIGSSSIHLSSIESLSSELTGQWRLVFGANSELAENYLFDVDTTYLSSDDFPSFELVEPMHGSTGISNAGFTASWTAPEGIASAGISLYRGRQFIDYYDLEPGQTTLAIDDLELEPGEYELNLSIYYQDIQNISIGTPYCEGDDEGEIAVLGVSGLPFEWITETQLRLQDRHAFTVVPEPSHYAALASALILVVILGKRMRRHG